MYYFYVQFLHLSLLTLSMKHVFVEPESQHVPRVKVIALLTAPYVYPSLEYPLY